MMVEIRKRIPRRTWVKIASRRGTLAVSREAFASLIFSAAAVVVAMVAGAPAPAEAHGRLGAAEGRCRLFIGPDIMNFTGYLPEASKNEFCEDIPATGPIIMVFDAEQEELRDMKVELRIVKDIGGEEKENEDLQAVTVAYREPKSYPTGTINFEHTFNEPGLFRRHRHGHRRSRRALGVSLPLLGGKELHARSADLSYARPRHDRRLLDLSRPSPS